MRKLEIDISPTGERTIWMFKPNPHRTKRYPNVSTFSLRRITRLLRRSEIKPEVWSFSDGVMEINYRL